MWGTMSSEKKLVKRPKPEQVSAGDTIDYGLTFQLNVERGLSVWLKSGVTTSVREGETTEEAWSRAKSFVDQRMDDLIEEYK